MVPQKGTLMHFHYMSRKVLKSRHNSNGALYTKEKDKVALKFFEYKTVRSTQ